MNEAAALAHLADALRTSFVAGGMAPALAAWETIPSGRAVEACNLPVRRWFKTALAQAPAPMRAVADALAAVEHQLPWRQTYAAGDFLDAYGWAELVGAKGPIASQTYAVGILLLGPQTFYPPHAHPAREFYAPISGVASWFSEIEGWRSVQPGALVHHPPNISHAMRTGDEPLLAAYCWTGDDVHTSASILDR